LLDNTVGEVVQRGCAKWRARVIRNWLLILIGALIRLIDLWQTIYVVVVVVVAVVVADTISFRISINVI